MRIGMSWHELRRFYTLEPKGPRCVSCIIIDSADRFPPNSLHSGRFAASQLQPFDFGRAEAEIINQLSHCHVAEIYFGKQNEKKMN